MWFNELWTEQYDGRVMMKHINVGINIPLIKICILKVENGLTSIYNVLRTGLTDSWHEIIDKSWELHF